MTAIYQPDSLRRSVWSVAMRFDKITICTELNGRVYKLENKSRLENLKSSLYIEDLPTMFPGLFVSRIDKGGFKQIQIYCDFRLLPKFDKWVHSPDDNDRALMITSD